MARAPPPSNDLILAARERLARQAVALAEREQATAAAKKETATAGKKSAAAGKKTAQAEKEKTAATAPNVRCDASTVGHAIGQLERAPCRMCTKAGYKRCERSGLCDACTPLFECTIMVAPENVQARATEIGVEVSEAAAITAAEVAVESRAGDTEAAREQADGEVVSEGSLSSHVGGLNASDTSSEKSQPVQQPAESETTREIEPAAAAVSAAADDDDERIPELGGLEISGDENPGAQDVTMEDAGPQHPAVTAEDTQDFVMEATSEQNGPEDIVGSLSQWLLAVGQGLPRHPTPRDLAWSRAGLDTMTDAGMTTATTKTRAKATSFCDFAGRLGRLLSRRTRRSTRSRGTSELAPVSASGVLCGIRMKVSWRTMSRCTRSARLISWSIGAW